MVYLSAFVRDFPSHERRFFVSCQLLWRHFVQFLQEFCLLPGQGFSSYVRVVVPAVTVSFHFLLFFLLPLFPLFLLVFLFLLFLLVLFA